METALTLQLNFNIPNDYEAQLISRFVDSIPTEILLEERLDRLMKNPFL